MWLSGRESEKNEIHEKKPVTSRCKHWLLLIDLVKTFVDEKQLNLRDGRSVERDNKRSQRVGLERRLAGPTAGLRLTAVYGNLLGLCIADEMSGDVLSGGTVCLRCQLAASLGEQ